MGWRQCFVQASHRMRLFLRWIKGLARMEHLGNTFTRRTLYRRMKKNITAMYMAQDDLRYFGDRPFCIAPLVGK